MNGAVGIAGPSEIAVRAGVEAVEAGGNAVDAAVATTLAALCTEVAIVGLDAGAFVTVWRRGEDPLVIDGGIAMPGLGQSPDRFGAAGRRVVLDYGGGMETIVGYGAVGVGGAIAALGEAADGWSNLSWAELVAPAAARVATGFPLGRASRTWLEYSHQEIFGWQSESAAVIHDARGRLLPAGATIRIPGLEDTLHELACSGPGSFYSGRLGDAIAACIESGGGLLGQPDRRAYRAIRRRPIRCEVDGWTIAAPPAPSSGGRALADMLAGMARAPRRHWTAASVATLAEVQREVFRAQHDPGQRAPSTVHISALDEEGLACAITASSGYGAGILVPGTGIWLNNCLGELELNPAGFHGLPPGRRIGSNMSPVAASGPHGAMLSLGSPGAERITTALLQVLLNFMQLGMPLEEALAAPRLHVEQAGGQWRAAIEPGLPVEALRMPYRMFDSLSMFFGGAGAVLRAADGALLAAADPRRQGAAVVVGGRG